MSPQEAHQNSKNMKVRGPKASAQPVQPTQAQVPPQAPPPQVPTAAPQSTAYPPGVQTPTTYPANQAPAQPRQPTAVPPTQYQQPTPAPGYPQAQAPMPAVPTTPQQPQPRPAVAPGVAPAVAPAVQPRVAATQKPKVKPTRKPGRFKLKPRTPTPKPPKGFEQFRYRTQIIKGSILPILYGIVSIQMLNLYTYEWPDIFEYNLMLILFGFLLGFGSMSGMTIVNLSRAKNRPQSGIKLDLRTGIVVFMPFIIITIVLAFFYSISLAWQFSTGYFLAAIFPMLIVLAYEYSSKKKFFIQESITTPSEGRKLIVVAA